ncbi:polysaccharide deacetylase family protein [Actinoplanes sp. NPDC026619]|uniref:polysaccharide deacetylase family protein n=1 Tax=Actinoplanes sp. NPDC026619 TaxID=3155798 RepID=UPI0033C8834A
MDLKKVLIAALLVFLPAAPAQASASKPVQVTFTFDDGVADQLQGKQLLEKYGMTGTFYINSALIGLPGYMTRTDLDALKAAGHEIGGHTATHQNLPTLSAAEQNRQICLDRNTLLSWGYAVTSFAYPFVEFDATTKSIVQSCGYNSARVAGDLRSPFSCADCPAAETVPPADRWAIRTPDDIESNWTLANLKSVVTRAETGGGWVPLNLHHLCAGSGCPAESIAPAVLDQFLAWLQPRSAPTIRTTVRTVQQVLGGAVKPAVTPTAAPAPGAPGVNTVRNPSFETAAAAVPDCYTSAGYGTNIVSTTRVNDAHSGTWAERVSMTSRTDGDAKLVPTFDLGQCSSQVAPGRTYQVSAWYKSTAPVFFTLYQRNAIGQWSYWTQSPRLAAAGAWTKATWLSPVPPGTAVAASFGLTIDSVGTLTVDDYGFADTTAAPAPVGVNALVNPSLEAAGADGFPQCWTGAGYGVNTPVWTRVTDAFTGTYAERLELTSRTDGDAKLIPGWDSGNCAPLVLTGHTYTLSVAYKSSAPTFLTLYRQDAAGTWSWWTQSPPFATSAAYTTATWASPAVPAGTKAVTFGLTLDSVGQLTTDNYAMVAN